MTVSVSLHPNLIERALLVATNDAFPEVIRVLNLFDNGRAQLSEAEGACLVDFARFMLSRAALHYPYRDAERLPYVPQHEDAFDDVHLGLYERLVASLLAPFPELFG
jgi:hypothetical protein